MEKNEKNYKLISLVADPERGVFNGTEYLIQFLDLFSMRFPYMKFEGEYTPDDYENWVTQSIKFLNTWYPWVFGVIKQDKVLGVVWACNWDGDVGDTPDSVEIGGFAAENVNFNLTTEVIKELVDLIFNNTQVEIIRSWFDETNRAAKWALLRSGFSTLETKRYWKKLDGLWLRGNCLSVTKEEYLKKLDLPLELNSIESFGDQV